MSDTGAVERAAREALPDSRAGEMRAGYVMGYRAALAAAAPTVEQVRHVLTSYGVDPWDEPYGVPQYDSLVNDLAALWGAR